MSIPRPLVIGLVLALALQIQARASTSSPVDKKMAAANERDRVRGWNELVRHWNQTAGALFSDFAEITYQPWNHPGTSNLDEATTFPGVSVHHLASIPEWGGVVAFRQRPSWFATGLSLVNRRTPKGAVTFFGTSIHGLYGLFQSKPSQRTVNLVSNIKRSHAIEVGNLKPEGVDPRLEGHLRIGIRPMGRPEVDYGFDPRQQTQHETTLVFSPNAESSGYSTEPWQLIEAKSTLFHARQQQMHIEFTRREPHGWDIRMHGDINNRNVVTHRRIDKRPSSHRRLIGELYRAGRLR